MTSNLTSEAENNKPVTYYFQITRGEILPIPTTNSPDTYLIEKLNKFDIKFNIDAFVDIHVEISTLNNHNDTHHGIGNIMLINYPDSMVDKGYGPCVHLRWSGFVRRNKFILSGFIDETTEGYWHITIF